MMPKKIVSAAGLASTLGLALAACTTATPEAPTDVPQDAPTAQPPEAPTEQPPEAPSTLPDEMLDVEWQLHSVLESEPAAQSVIPQPQNYTIRFAADGTAAILADCNNVGASYTVSGSNLTLTLGPSTLAFCGEDSGDNLYMTALGAVTSYAMSEYGMALDVADAARLQYIEANDVIDLPDEPGGVDITANVNVNVRTGPGTQFRIAHTALQGDQGELFGESPDDQYWVVEFPEDHPHYDLGWVSKSVTTVSNPDNLEISLITPPLLNPTVYVTPPEGGEPQGNVTQMAPVMTGPGNAYQIWGLTSVGPTVVLTGKSDTGFEGIWWEIELPTTYAESGRGWVDQIYLSTTYADLVQPAFQAPPPPDLEARPTASGGSQAAVRFTEKTAVRAGPGDNYSSYGDAEEGWVMGIVGVSSDGDWWVVNLPTQTAAIGYGWVPMDKTVCSKCDIPSPYTPEFRTP